MQIQSIPFISINDRECICLYFSYMNIHLLLNKFIWIFPHATHIWYFDTHISPRYTIYYINGINLICSFLFYMNIHLLLNKFIYAWKYVYCTEASFYFKKFPISIHKKTRNFALPCKKVSFTLVLRILVYWHLFSS